MMNVARLRHVAWGSAYGVTAAFFFAALLLACGCSSPKAKESNDAQAIPVKVMKVTLQDINNVLAYVGSIKAQDEVMVYPKVSGKVIEKIKDMGQEVKKGEAICYLDRDEVGQTYARVPVESPMDGFVGKLTVDLGSQVTAQTSVAVVLNMDKVKISLDIPELYLPKIALGQEARIAVDAYPQAVFAGKVTKISPMVNLENRAAPIEITLDNADHRLKSGMFARVMMDIESRKKVPVILKEAMRGKDHYAYVYIIENNHAISRKVAIGIHEGPYFEVTEGLKEGDAVVIVGQQRLYDNAQVAQETDAQ